jgi:hypothetical protein
MSDTLFPDDVAPATADGFPPLPKNKRVWAKLGKTIDALMDLCDHELSRDGTIHMTSTPAFFERDGHGIALLTCPECRPLVEKAIDQACGSHDDAPWPAKKGTP